jgi:hypothetical protein
MFRLIMKPNGSSLGEMCRESGCLNKVGTVRNHESG